MAAEAQEEGAAGKRGREEAEDEAEEEPPKKEKREEAPAEAGQEAEAEAEEAPAAATSAELDVGREAVLWLSEGRRLQKLAALAGAELRAPEDGCKVLAALPDGATAGIEWAEFCVQAKCAQRTGQVLSARPPSAAPALSVVQVPREEARFILGKAGGRLCQLSEEHDVIAVFGQEAGSGPSLEVGSLVEAKFEGRDRWFEAKIVEVGKDTVRVKWTYDEDVPETDVPSGDVRAHPEDSGNKAAEASEIEVGALVDAKFGNKDRLFEAVVLSVDEKTVKVKWTYDEDVPPSEVDRAEVKPRPKAATDPLYVLGPDRGRLDLELKVLTLIESKVPGFVSARPRASDEGPGVGLSVVPLLNDGEMKAKVIGKGGSVRNKISKTCGTSLEYLGNLAYVVGTMQERLYTAKLLELLQSCTSGTVEEVPSELEAICTRVPVPQEASFVVTGKQRANMNQIEEETRTLTFWSPAPTTAAPAKMEVEAEGAMQLEVGKFVQGRFNKRWFEATILELTKDDSGNPAAKVRWDYDETEVSVVLASDIREVPDGKSAEAPARKEDGDGRVFVIFGPERARKHAELLVMATVETKCPGNYKDFELPAAGEGFAHEVWRLGPEEARRCEEQRQRAAAAAAHCLLEPVGDALHLGGTGVERSRARDYIQWLAMATPSVPEVAGRSDVDELLVPGGKRANLVERTLAPIERDTETLIFYEGGASSTGDARLFVCGSDGAKREEALTRLREQQEKAPQRPPANTDDDIWGLARSPKVVYVVSKDEEERRRKRAERFAAPPGKKR